MFSFTLKEKRFERSFSSQLTSSLPGSSVPSPSLPSSSNFRPAFSDFGPPSMGFVQVCYCLHNKQHACSTAAGKHKKKKQISLFAQELQINSVDLLACIRCAPRHQQKSWELEAPSPLNSISAQICKKKKRPVSVCKGG